MENNVKEGKTELWITAGPGPARDCLREIWDAWIGGLAFFLQSRDREGPTGG